MASSLEALWPDEDRRDNALERVLARVNHEPEPELTATQLRVLEAASYGLGGHERAEVLGLTYNQQHDQEWLARRALRAKNLPHAVAEALRKGLIK